jgi:hypothetical protein
MVFPPANTCDGKYCVFCILLLLTITFYGCAPTAKTASVYDGGQLIRPETVLGKIERPHDTILKAIAKIEVSDTNGRYSTKAALLIKRPSSLRIEAIPIIGPVNLFVCIHEDILKIFFPQRGTFYIGKATPENLVNIAKYFPAGVSIEELVPIMFGTYPFVHNKNISLKGSVEARRYRVDMIRADGRRLQSIWIDITSHNLVEAQVFKTDDRVAAYTARFEEFNESPDASSAMPLKITITSETVDHVSVTIRYSSVQFSTDIEAPTFDLPTPPGIDPIYLD